MSPCYEIKILLCYLLHVRMACVTTFYSTFAAQKMLLVYYCLLFTPTQSYQSPSAFCEDNSDQAVAKWQRCQH